MPMYWETNPATGNWQLTKDLWVWDAGAWQPVRAAWIWSGSAWEQCHVASGSLDSITVKDVACDPVLGSFRVSWTYTTLFPSEWTITIDYSFNGGSSWTTYDSGIDLTTSPYNGSLDGLPGFSTLDSTDFRISMVSGSTQATSSPRYAYPTYICV